MANSKTIKLPIVPLRGILGYPNMVFPILVGRPRSLAAVQDCMMGNKKLFLVAQKNSIKDEVKSSDLYRVGIEVKVLQVMRLPEGSLKILVQGERRLRVIRYFYGRNYTEATCEEFEEDSEKVTPRIEALARKALERFIIYSHMEDSVPDEIVNAIETSEPKPEKLADLIAAHLPLKLNAKQKMLATKSVADRLGQILAHIGREIEILRLEKDIDDRVRSKITESQREYYLREQMDVIKKELNSEFSSPAVEEIYDKMNATELPDKVKEKAEGEIKKLDRTHPSSPEAAVLHNYLDWILSLPWENTTEDNLDIERARKILDEDHYGLDKIKTRITEHIAVMSLSKSVKGPILCLVGPPGVGKTSLGKSIARALQRNFVRVSLGGVRDEAEIRGHRRTYIGALPGRIIQQIKKAGSKNPVFLLDEIDKIGADFRGDPAAALLEVLDPDQNSTFVDHYMELEFNLSGVFFITTANTIAGIPPPLLDRMELLRIPGYLLSEKKQIAKNFLVKKAKIATGLEDINIRLSDSAFEALIKGWTREAGVRELERMINKVLRQLASRIVKRDSKPKRVDISDKDLEKYLGVPQYKEALIPDKMLSGESLGLAWTSAGGEILRFETAITNGEKKLLLTGRLGDVMKESARAALTFIRNKFSDIDPLGEKDMIHIHVPEGSTPKDGPSAGIAIASALASLFKNRPLKNDIAMTGEITLAGHVLPIGGLAEKLVAAKRYELKTVIIPKANEPDLEKIPIEVKKGLDIKTVDHMDQVLQIINL